MIPKRPSLFEEMRRMQEEIDTMFNSLYSRGFPESEISGMEKPRLLTHGTGTNIPSALRNPLSDIYETDREVVAAVELPGVDKKDIRVNIADNALEIKVERKDEKKEEDRKKGFIRQERSFTGFYRQFPLPSGVDASKADAAFRNGVLELRLPKTGGAKKKQFKTDVK